MDGSSPASNADSFFNMSSDTLIGEDAAMSPTKASSFPGAGPGSGAGAAAMNPARTSIRRHKMQYVAKFGDFGTGDGQFSEPSGVSVNGNRDILVADTNNHRVQIFDHEGRFKFAFGECGKRDGQMLYPNRVAVARNGDVVVTERSPTHQIQVSGVEWCRRVGVCLHCTDTAETGSLVQMSSFSFSRRLVHSFCLFYDLHFGFFTRFDTLSKINTIQSAPVEAENPNSNPNLQRHVLLNLTECHLWKNQSKFTQSKIK